MSKERKRNRVLSGRKWIDRGCQRWSCGTHEGPGTDTTASLAARSGLRTVVAAGRVSGPPVWPQAPRKVRTESTGVRSHPADAATCTSIQLTALSITSLAPRTRRLRSTQQTTFRRLIETELQGKGKRHVGKYTVGVRPHAPARISTRPIAQLPACPPVRSPVHPSRHINECRRPG